jgi:RNA polymerase sigma-70 factor, ECF subfamily
LDSDEALYRRARAGDLGAFDRLYARHERRLFSFIYRVLGDRPDAEEVFHDVMVNVITGPEATFSQARFVSYMFRIARNACANYLRRRRRGSHALEQLVLPEAEVPGAEERLVEEERATALADAANRLPASLADVFALRSSGLSYDEIAEALGVPLGTVKSRMSALVAHLRGEMA